jgi:hypothetical protein
MMLAVAGCGRSPASPAGTRGLSGSETLSGTLVGWQQRRPIAGASVTVSPEGYDGVVGSATTRTGIDGGFTFTSLPTGLLQLSFEATDYVKRQVWLGGARTGLVVDAIENAGAFSLDFYRDFVRNGSGGVQSLQRTRPWTIAPSFYINTRLPSGEDIPAAMLQGIVRVITNTVPELSASKFRVPIIEIGTEPRPSINGWVNVSMFPAGALGVNVHGRASVGGDIGGMNLEYDPLREARYHTDYPFQCEGAIVEVADHEMTHIMGFFHAGDGDDFQSGPGCPGFGRSAKARHHAAIMYSRPKGNMDIDVDPLVNTASDGSTTPIIVSCHFRRSPNSSVSQFPSSPVAPFQFLSSPVAHLLSASSAPYPFRRP